MAANLGYEKEYHDFFHKHLLTDEKYYKFRAKYSNENYWPYFDLDGKVLEFGIGLGQNVYFNRHRAFGVDISKFCASKCADREIEVLEDISSVKAASVSGVLCSHCLEHLENPAFFLREFLRVLKPGGKLVLLLPVEGQDIKRFEKSPTQHLFAWNFQTIGELLSLVGFNVRFGKFNYATGFSKFYRLPYGLANYMIRTVGLLADTKEMVVIAEKPRK